MKGKAFVGIAAVTLSVSMVAGVGAKKRITWWAPPEYSWKQMEKLYEKSNPNVDVQIVNGDLDKFYTMITAGLMPDVWGSVSTPGISADVNRNWALDLTPYIRRDGKSMRINELFPGVMAQFKVNGKQFGIPMYAYADYYFYNKQLYAKAGLPNPPLDSRDKDWNWEQMVANAQKTTVKSPDGKVSQYGLTFPTTYFDFPNYYHMWGAEPYSEETLRTSVPQAVHFNTPEMVNCLTRMWELKWRFNVAGGDFRTGKVAASLDYGYNIPGLMLTKGLTWAIAPLPWARTNIGTFWPGGWRIAKVSKNKDLAWDFVKFLLSPDAMRIMMNDDKSSKRGCVPIRKTLFHETFGREVAQVTGMKSQEVLDLFDQADSVGIVKYQETVCLHADLSKHIEPELARIFNNKVDPKTGAANVQKAIDRALPPLFQRWMRNIKFTGADKNHK